MSWSAFGYITLTEFGLGKKITKYLGHDTDGTCRKSKPGPPEYEATSPTTETKYEGILLSNPYVKQHF